MGPGAAARRPGLSQGSGFDFDSFRRRRRRRAMVRRFQPFLLRKERKTLIVTDDAGEEAKGKGRAARFYLEIDR